MAASSQSAETEFASHDRSNFKFSSRTTFGRSLALRSRCSKITTGWKTCESLRARRLAQLARIRERYDTAADAASYQIPRAESRNHHEPPGKFVDILQQ